MPRTRSETTIKKVEYAQKLLAKKGSLSQKDLGAAVSKKFGTGLDFRVLANVKAGRKPFDIPKRASKKRKKRGAAAARSASPGKKRGRKRGRGPGRPRKVKVGARRGRRPANPLASAPAYIVAVKSQGTAGMIGVSGKAAVRAEIERLLASGVEAADLAVYGREDLAIEVTHSVSF